MIFLDVLGGFIGGLLGYGVAYVFHRWRTNRRYRQFARGAVRLR